VSGDGAVTVRKQQPAAEQRWLAQFAQALERGAERAARFAREERLLACGFTSNVDRLAQLDDALLERLFEGTIVPNGLPRISLVKSVDDLRTGIAQTIAAGDGTDLVIRDEQITAWLLERMNGRKQIGGTGVQAASTLATLGFPVLVHLTGRSPEQIDALVGREKIMIGTPDGLAPVETGGNPDDATMWHPALEFAAGLRAPMVGYPAAPASNRVLVGFDPVNCDFQIDPGFSAVLNDPTVEIGALLVSGFSQLHEVGPRERVLHDAAEALRRWRAVRPDVFIHLELGAMPDFAMVAAVVAALHPHVTSIGMNIDELREFFAVLGVTMAVPGPELVAQMRHLQQRYPTPRLSVHTREFCLTLTEGNADQERDALLFASLTAATRSRIAAFPSLNDLSTTLTDGSIDADGLALVDVVSAETGVVATPGICFTGPAATVGLGDSFTGGLLAMLE
jgi:ADP-dependent phosphofructokinase/glucokinase